MLSVWLGFTPRCFHANVFYPFHVFTSFVLILPWADGMIKLKINFTQCHLQMWFINYISPLLQQTKHCEKQGSNSPVLTFCLGLLLGSVYPWGPDMVGPGTHIQLPPVWGQKIFFYSADHTSNTTNLPICDLQSNILNACLFKHKATIY